MIALKITINPQNVGAVQRFRAQCPVVIDGAVRDTAAYGKGLLIKSTAKGQTGLTQGGWDTLPLGQAVYKIWNKFKHARFLETGTGLFGPLHKRIFPLQAKALMWISFRKNTPTGIVFAKSTAGMPAQPMIAPNMDAIRNDLTLRMRDRITKLWQRCFK